MPLTNALHMGPGWYMRRTANATALLPFYRDALGTSVIRGAEPVYFLWAGETFIIELKADGSLRGERVTAPALHPCTPIFHSRDLQVTVDRLLNNGASLISRSDTAFGPEAFVLDPDQQIVGIRQPKDGELAIGRSNVSSYNPGCAPLPEDVIGLRSILRPVVDIGTMSSFYGDTVGFKDLGKHNGRHLFDLGEGVHLELTSGGEQQNPPKDRAEISNQFIVRVEDHDAFNAALKANDVPFCNDSFRWNSADMSICIEPEGHIMGFEERFEPHEYGTPRDPFEEDLEADRRWRQTAGQRDGNTPDGFDVGYAATRYGAMHYTRKRGTDPTKRPLICLHPSPYSGAYFRTFMQACNESRDVIAIDHIGYGNSVKQDEPLTTPEHAMAIGDALDDMGFGVSHSGRVDVMGYHSGSTFAGELAILRADLVAKLAFVTYPYRKPEDRKEHLEGIRSGSWLTDNLNSLEGKWSTNIGRRAEGVPLSRGVENLVEDLKSGANFWHGFESVFTYAAEDRLPRIRQRTLVINTDSMLTEPTANANAFLKNSDYRMLDHMKLGIYELHADELAEIIAVFLDEPVEPYVAYKP